MLFINGAKKRAPAAASELLKLLKKIYPASQATDSGAFSVASTRLSS